MRDYCDVCLTERRGSVLSIYGKPLGDLTKEELRILTQKWGYYGFRSRITRHAQRVFKESGKTAACQVCGFDFHVHLCHKKDVADFDGGSLVKEINALDNLVVLCPNHHVMFDRKALKL